MGSPSLVCASRSRSTDKQSSGPSSETNSNEDKNAGNYGNERRRGRRRVGVSHFLATGVLRWGRDRIIWGHARIARTQLTKTRAHTSHTVTIASSTWTGIMGLKLLLQPRFHAQYGIFKVE